MFNPLINFIKKRWLLITIIFLVLIVICWIIFGNSKTSTKYIDVKRGEVISEVSVTGKVKPLKSIDLAFEQSGRLSRILVNVGDKVYQGQTLAVLDNASIYAQLAQAQADVKAQQAKLDELKKGARSEDINAKQAELKKAQEDLKGYLDNVINILNDAYSKSDDAMRTKTSDLFTNGESDNPLLNSSFIDSQDAIDAKAQRLLMRNTLNSWYANLQTISTSSSEQTLKSALQTAQNNLSLARNFVNKMMDLLNGPNTFSQTALDTYKASMGAAITNINTASASVASQIQLINSQEFTIEKIQNELNLKLAGNTPENIAGQEAQLERAKAAVELIQSQLAKTVLRSPIEGVVSRQDGKVGAIASPGQSIVSVISNSKYQIEIFISETDIAKIKTGQPAKVTLDAYGENEEFDATVIKVDPAATLVSGVNAYKVTLQFTNDDNRIKSGMGANVKIATTSRENVVAVPKSAIIMRGNDMIVLVSRNGNSPEERKVELGIKGSNGYVEIISGLTEGESVVVFGGTQ
jgi:HlyD family secretion protein